MRAVLLTPLLVAAGCQCLAPVEEDAGARPDGGAGLDAGGPFACATWTDCGG